jgi:3-dehydroquinate synthetase
MVDASVGGKTGVNLAIPSRQPSNPSASPTLLKNMVGAFWQPRAVLADIDTLASLPPRIFRAGLAECIKHAMLSAGLPAPHADPDLLDWTESAFPRILAQDAAALTELISRNVRTKAAIVARDEREEDDSGGRALLNLGHTFAHAIETISHLSPDTNPAHAPLQHGEAVALGLIAAASTAAAAQLAPADLPARITRLIAAAGLPTRVGNLPPPDEIVARMAHDKKTLAGRLRLILPTAPGHAAVFTDPALQAIQSGIRAITG